MKSRIRVVVPVKGGGTIGKLISLFFWLMVGLLAVAILVATAH